MSKLSLQKTEYNGQCQKQDALHIVIAKVVLIIKLLIFFWIISNFIILLIYLYFPITIPQEGFLYSLIANTETVLVCLPGMGNKNNAIGFCYRYLFIFVAIITSVRMIFLFQSISGFGVGKKIIRQKIRFYGKTSSFFFESYLFQSGKFIFMLWILIAISIWGVYTSIYGTYDRRLFEYGLFITNLYFSFAPICLLPFIIVYLYFWTVSLTELIYLTMYQIFYFIFYK